MHNKKKIWITASVVAALVAASATVYLLWPKQTQETVIDATPSIAVQKSEITVLIKGSGPVKATNQTVVYTEQEGTIRQVVGKLNAHVQKGQVLVSYKPKDNTKDVTEQQNTLKQQQSDLHAKQEQYKQQMMDNTAQTELDSTHQAIEKAKDDITTTQTELARLLKEQAAPAPLLAPADGTITKVNVFAGSATSAGAEAFTIVNYRDLSATIQVDELEILKVRPGMKATLTLDAMPAQAFIGHVASIANEGSAKNGVSTFGVTIHLDDPGQIKAGMSAQANILVQHKQNILVLPIESIIQQGNRYIVNKLDRTTQHSPASPPPTKEQPITVGIHDQSQVEIVSGLKEGDLISVPSSDMSGLSTATSNANQGASGLTSDSQTMTDASTTGTTGVTDSTSSSTGINSGDATSSSTGSGDSSNSSNGGA
ncbi:efflux RND transporter periplasmic adaptor subunit [Paenibacillus campi]|uniref:efflux RND transporter periplasmic adaptor subunit n=1 Tax=Paenibacillus campi TaxID=3106031 RepID=UPI002AFE945B|nr:efflux RND transporter periplasmic adaptor subunit [Paenibacillus sp. SGZ-1009]